MAAIVSGVSLGLTNSSAGVLGAQGKLGAAPQGSSGERVYVNAASGNLVLQRQDEVLLGTGADISLLRTYNSQGLLNDDNGDNWRLGVYKRIYNLTGTVNAAGSTVTRVEADGAESVYVYDAASGKYLNNDGGGAQDRLSYAAATRVWTWTDGSSQLVEKYDGANGGRITQTLDPDGNGLTYTYNAAGLITQVADASGEITYLDYTGTNLTQLRTVKSGGATLTRVRYAYDASNRLSQVTVDLSPEDNAVTDGNTYVTSYTYEGTSRRVATLTQSDGTSLAFTYIQVGAGWRVATLTDALGRITSFTYNTTTRTTTVTDPLRLATVLAYDTAGQLTSITAPPVGGVSQVVSYAYDANGNVTQATDARGNTVVYQYDANDNRTLERDAAGNTVTRVFGAKNELLAETSYLVPDPDGAGAGQPASPLTARYVYDANNHLRFVVSGAGRVSEYRYNSFGQQVAAIQYTSAQYDVSGLMPTSTLTEAQLVAWVPADRSASMRSDTTYDFRGQVASLSTYASVDAAGSGVVDGKQAVAQYVYDQAGNLLKTIDGRGSITADPNDYTTSYLYDGLGRLLSTTDALGRITLTQYDAANRKTVLTFANGLVTTSTCDVAGQLISLLQGSGSQTLGETKYCYDADGRLRRTLDPTGLSTHLLYDEAGRKIADIDANGSLTEYRFDANGNLVKSIQYANPVSIASLATLTDAQGNPTGVTLASIRPAADPGNDRFGYALYDKANRAVLTLTPSDADATLAYATQNFYDGAGRLTDTVRYNTAVGLAGLPDLPIPDDVQARIASNALDRHARVFYDAEGKLIGKLDGEGFLTEYQYDAAGQLTHTIGYAKAATSASRYTDSFSALKSNIAGQGADPNDQHAYVFYNARGQRIAALDAEGYLTECQYDLAGNKTVETRYYDKAQSYTGSQTPAQLRPANTAARVTVSDYDAANQLKSVTTLPDNIQTSYAYDSVGHLVSTTSAAGTGEARTVQARYDLQGRLTGELSGEGSAALQALLAQNPNATAAQIDAIWASYGIRHAYDAAGRRISTTDANGLKTLFYYDSANRLAYTVNALGEVSQSVYNAFGDVTDTRRYTNRISTAGLTGGLVPASLAAAIAAVATPTGSNADAHSRINYTLRGAIREILAAPDNAALTSATRYTYNAFGELATTWQQRDAAGQGVTSSYARDRRGLTTDIYEDTSAINRRTQTQYDAFGRLTRSIDGNGILRTFAYDKLGRTVTTTTASGTSVQSSTSQTYDAFGRVRTSTDARDNVTAYSYDDAARSFSITTPEGIRAITTLNRHGETETVEVQAPNGQATRATRYVYDANGNLAQTVEADGTLNLTTRHFYDHTNRRVTTLDANGHRAVFTYDAASRLYTRVVDPRNYTDEAGAAVTNPAALDLTTTYVYDGQGRTLTVTDANGVITRSDYDAKGQLTSVTVDQTGLNLRTDYAYDAAGHVLTVIEAAGTTAASTTEYRYDALGRRTQETRDLGGLNIVTAYVYDLNDNLISRTEAQGTSEARITRQVYDAANRLVFTIDALGNVTEAVYDADHNRTALVQYGTPLTVTVLGQIDADRANAVTTVRSNLVTANSEERSTVSVYDRDNRLRFAVDAIGYVKETRYDGAGAVTDSVAYANALNTTAVLLAAGYTSAQIAAMSADQIRALLPAVFTIDRINAGLTLDAARDQLTHYVYDSAGRVASATDALGQTEYYQYDAVGNKIAYTNKKGKRRWIHHAGHPERTGTGGDPHDLRRARQRPHPHRGLRRGRCPHHHVRLRQARPPDPDRLPSRKLLRRRPRCRGGLRRSQRVAPDADEHHLLRRARQRRRQSRCAGRLQLQGLRCAGPREIRDRRRALRHGLHLRRLRQSEDAHPLRQ